MVFDLRAEDLRGSAGFDFVVVRFDGSADCTAFGGAVGVSEASMLSTRSRSDVTTSTPPRVMLVIPDMIDSFDSAPSRSRLLIPA